MSKTLDELIAEGRRLYYEGSLTIKEATDKLVTEIVDDEAEQQIRWRGIHDYLNLAIKNDRSEVTGGRAAPGRQTPVIQYAPRGGEGKATRLLSLYPRMGTTWYDGADGKPRPLLFFTLDDWRRRATAERNVIRGATARMQLAAAAAEALVAEGKSVTSDLTRKTLDNLEQLANQVFSQPEAGAASESRIGLAEVSGEAS